MDMTSTLENYLLTKYPEKTAFGGKPHDNVRTDHAGDSRGWAYLGS
jgi:hypothetical protein